MIDQPDHCAPGAEPAAHNIGVNWLCLSQGLSDEPGLQLDVLTHEAIHVVQDCLDGLETPSSSTISLMLQAQGGFSTEQVDHDTGYDGRDRGIRSGYPPTLARAHRRPARHSDQTNLTDQLLVVVIVFFWYFFG